MPTSIDPQPGQNEFECARCGALVYYELTRCPNCGVNLYEPDDEGETYQRPAPASCHKPGLLEKAGLLFRRLLGKPYSAEDVFGDALDQASLYNDLLGKTGGDHAAVERLIDYERQRQPDSARRTWLQNAIQRWEKDNRTASPARDV